MTNGDKIRRMTDEELAEHLGDYICNNRLSGECQRFKSCEECKMSWLQEPVKKYIEKVSEDADN